jgi:catechol 2,3-dioxygenase-like lactoylglutathione lyase family enzyme
MPLPEINALTLAVGVGDMAKARAFYDRLFGREPDFVPDDGDLQEYETSPGAWFQITTTLEPGKMQRVRFGVPDLAVARAALLADGVAVTEAEEVDEVLRWCDFTDPFGNPLGIFQDLSD